MPKRLTTYEFVERSMRRFPGAFKYDGTIYINAKTPIRLACTKHGDFDVLPDVHIRVGSAGGCPRCAGNSRKSSQDFVADAKRIHGDTYDYSSTVYVSAKAKVSIICPHHGPFLQEPSSHLSGVGCPTCWKERKTRLPLETLRKREETFLKMAKGVHGDDYDYSMVFYERSNKPVQILCPKHGAFFQRPNVHLRGGGCPTCADQARGLGRRSSIHEFIRRAAEVHDNFYDYSSAIYVGNHKPLVIICPEHGPFEQQPSNHLNGAGCIECARWRRGEVRKATRASNLFEDFREVHGDRYDYSRVSYTDSRTKVEVLCPSHGSFFVTPANHLQGIRCKECALENRPDYVDSRVVNDPEYAERLGYIYLLRVSHPIRSGFFYKVGITSREHPEQRFRYSRYANFLIEVVASKRGSMRQVWTEEKLIKVQIKERRAGLSPFCSDYWHWTESFVDVNEMLLAAESAFKQ